MGATWQEMIEAHLDKRVTVLLDDYTPSGKPITVTGILRSADPDGTVKVERDDGRVTCAWPALMVGSCGCVGSVATWEA